MTEGPGRACPVDYRYGARALRAAPAIEADTLYVAGGLYGNTCALDALLDLVALEPGAKLVFNGDFNWFNVEASEYRRVNEAVLAHAAIRGNVESELAQPAKGAGCGCSYPKWVGDGEVERSNRIMEKLQATAAREPGLTGRIGSLPMFAVARVGETRIGIVHGDAESLAGWGFSQEVLSTDEGRLAASAAFEAAQVRVIASSHTCLPVLQSVPTAKGEAVLANNGAAGMPNFRGTRHGIVTRISVRPPKAGALYGALLEDECVHVHAVAVRYDAQAWEERFLAQWPPGSDAWRSYFQRICNGPDYSVRDAVRVSSHSAAAFAL